MTTTYEPPFQLITDLLDCANSLVSEIASQGDPKVIDFESLYKTGMYIASAVSSVQGADSANYEGLPGVDLSAGAKGESVGWLREEIGRARERSAMVPPHARPVYTGSKPAHRLAQERYWNGTRSGLDALCKWANGFDPLDEPVLTYNFTDDGQWDTPLLATEGDFRELRNGDYVIRDDAGEFHLRRLT